MRYLLLVWLTAFTMLATSCSRGDQDVANPGPAVGNFLINPGFEEGRDPWFSLQPPDFTLSEDVAHGGKASALLQLRGAAEEQQTKISYLVQEVSPQEFPEVLAGLYRVDKWRRGTDLQYLQVAVIVFGADNLPGGFPNHQVRYILAGIDAAPFTIDNAKYVFLGGTDPSLDQWVPLSANVSQDFANLWEAVPTNYSKIRVLFEVRYDGKTAGQDLSEADVYYDDLYFGTPY